MAAKSQHYNNNLRFAEKNYLLRLKTIKKRTFIFSIILYVQVWWHNLYILTAHSTITKIPYFSMSFYAATFNHHRCCRRRRRTQDKHISCIKVLYANFLISFLSHFKRCTRDVHCTMYIVHILPLLCVCCVWLKFMLNE